MMRRRGRGRRRRRRRRGRRKEGGGCCCRIAQGASIEQELSLQAACRVPPSPKNGSAAHV